jgi:hypothetical protein
MYDSINVDSIPDDATLMAGYINGKSTWQSYYPMVARFPNATVLSISVAAHNSNGTYVAADILDIEKGDATPSEAPGWVTAMRSLGRTPTLYCSRLGTWPATQQAIGAAKLAPPNYWIADYTSTAHLVPGSVATQWTDTGPYDLSLTNGTWPSVVDTPPAPPLSYNPITVGDYVLNTVAVTTDANGNGWLPTTLPWSSFLAATIQGSDPNTTANGGDGVYWPGYCKVQNRNGFILVSVIGSLPLSTINVYVATA